MKYLTSPRCSPTGASPVIPCRRAGTAIQRTQDLLDHLRSGPDTLESFDEALFSELAEKIIVTDNETLRFRLINGLELTESIERTKR